MVFLELQVIVILAKVVNAALMDIQITNLGNEWHTFKSSP